MKESRVYLIHIRDYINIIKQYTVEGKEVFFNVKNVINNTCI